MIKCDNGNIELHGTNYEAMLDFNCILDTLFNSAPEIVIATLFVWADDLEKQSLKCNKNILPVAIEICKTIRKEVQDNE